MDRLDCDRMFVAVLDTGSFAAAAARLGTSTGQASKLVSRLEADLGVQLLKRTTRALSATEAGRAYFERIRALLEEFDALDASVRNASGAPSGRLRITAPLTFGVNRLVPMLMPFANEFPEIQIDVSFSDRVVNLVEEGFDVAIRIGKPGDSSLIARRLCDVRIVLVASPAYLAARGEPQTPADLAEHECIIDTNFRDPLNWRLRPEPDGEYASFPVTGRMSFSNAEACVAAARAGMGIARIPSFIAGDALRDGELKLLLAPLEEEKIGLFAIYPPARHLAVKVRSLVDFLAGAYRTGPDWERGW